MKTYNVKNYKGNIVESLTKFQNKYKGFRIVEALEENGSLKIKVDEAEESDLDFSDLTNRKVDGEAKEFELLVIKPGGIPKHHSFEKAIQSVVFKAKDSKDAANAIGDALQNAIDSDKEPWFPFKLFCGDEECTHDLSDMMFDREFIKFSKVPTKS